MCTPDWSSRVLEKRTKVAETLTPVPRNYHVEEEFAPNDGKYYEFSNYMNPCNYVQHIFK